MMRHYYLRSLGPLSHHRSACARAFKQARHELRALDDRAACCEQLATARPRDSLPKGAGGHDLLAIF